MPVLYLSGKRKSGSARGFTLLEVLVAISVFSVVALVSYNTLDTYLDQRERLTHHYGRLERLQRLFILLERDLQFAVNRIVRVDGDEQPAVMSDEGDVLIAMTVAQADLDSPTGSSLKRVEWRLEGKELIREQWSILDRSRNGEGAKLLVSDEIDEMNFSYFFYQSNRGVDERNSVELGEFPNGIELTLTLDSGPEFRRLFAIN